MTNRFDAIADDARNKTNAEMKNELARHVTLTAAELNRLLPDKGDKETFARLMGVVTSSASKNNKLAALESNLGEFGGVILKLLGLFA